MRLTQRCTYSTLKSADCIWGCCISITAQDNSDKDDPAEPGSASEDVFSANPAIVKEGNLSAIRAVTYMLGGHLYLESI